MKNLSDLILLQFSVLMWTRNESPAVMQYYICCCFGKFRILNLFTGLPAESHWWEDEIVWRRALFKMKFSINNKQKQPSQKDKICYIMEAPPVPLLCTRRVLNRVHIILLWDLPFLFSLVCTFTLCTSCLPFIKERFFCGGESEIYWEITRPFGETVILGRTSSPTPIPAPPIPAATQCSIFLLPTSLLSFSTPSSQVNVV